VNTTKSAVAPIGSGGGMMGRGDHRLWLQDPERHPYLTDSFRNLKNELKLHGGRTGARLFLVTGPDQGIGVSTVAANLALILAQDLLDQKILLVDTDMSSPSLHTVFGMASSPGLMEYLVGQEPFAAHVQQTALPNLHLLATGRADRRVSSPYDLKRFDRLLEEARGLYDFVILDSEPALRSSNTRIVAGKSDGVVIVAEANATRYEVLIAMQKELADKCPLIGTVLNKRRFFIPKFLYRTL
jgi:protein-tyrosine kinase